MSGPRQGHSSRSSLHAIVRCAAWLGLLLCAVSTANAALTPKDIVLVVNTKIPASRALAESYARQRHIPDGHIVEIEVAPWGLANPPEEIPFDAYEPSVAKPVRDFLTRTGLANSTKCLVIFYGVPLRIGRRSLTSAEQNELISLKTQLDQDRQTVSLQIADAEKLTIELDPTFKPQSGSELPTLAARLQAAMNSGFRAISTIKDAKARQAAISRLVPSLDA